MQVNTIVMTAKKLRQIHRFLAPIMLLPIMLTVLTGALYQLVDMTGRGSAFDWLLQVHKGNFRLVDLQIIYPFLNVLGLLLLVGSGIVLWLQPRRRSQKKLSS